MEVGRPRSTCSGCSSISAWCGSRGGGRWSTHAAPCRGGSPCRRRPPASPWKARQPFSSGPPSVTSSSSSKMRTPNRLLLAVTLVGSLLAHVPAAAQQDGPVYVVVEGDTLFGIAIRFGTTVEALAAANGISDLSAIFPGMRLFLPGFEGIRGVLETRPVALGESLASLALEHQIPTDRLAQLNRIAHPGRLYVGQP